MNTSHMDRRTLLLRGGQLAGGIAVFGVSSSLLSACGASAGVARTTASAAMTAFTFQLGWLANSENMGIYMAQTNEHFKNQQLDATIVPGGPSVSVGPLIASGKAFVGLDSADTIARARNQGAPLKIVGAALQKNPSAVMSLATNPIKTPQELVGKRLGIQQSGQAIYDAFFRANHIDPKKVTYVPVQFDPAPLVNGDVDAFASFQTVQPIQLAQKGIKTTTFLLADFGYAIWADTFVVNESTLKDPNKRKELVQVMRASVQGWEDAVANPEEGARLAVDNYGKSLKLNLKDETLAAKALVPLVETPETKRNGLLTMSQSGMDANIATMKSVGIQASATELFDPSVLHDAFGGKTHL